MNMKKLIIITVIYLLSVIGAYKFFRQAYSKGGRWESQDAGILEFVFTICPAYNTAFALIYVCHDINMNAFFKVQK